MFEHNITQDVFEKFVNALVEAYEKSEQPREAAQEICRTHGDVYRECFKIICHIKEYDGRITPRVRNYYYSCPVNGMKTFSPNVYNGYALWGKGLDKIHPAHLNQIMSECMNSHLWGNPW